MKSGCSCSRSSAELPIDHPEGIAIDGDKLYVVSDSEARLFVFEIAIDGDKLYVVSDSEARLFVFEIER